MEITGERNEDVWRVCEVIKGPCKHCPASEDFGDGYGDCRRACYLQALECINTVETGNPWRKTEGVREPWTVLARPQLSDGPSLTETVAELQDIAKDIDFGDIIRDRPGPELSDERVEAMCRAHDVEDAAQRGEPSPWEGYDPRSDNNEFRITRMIAMRCALSVLESDHG
jgi:hypothetical protein